MSRPLWVMRVPVISTAHLPTLDALDRWEFTPKALVSLDGGGFLLVPDVYVEDILEEGHWMEPIQDWLLKHGYDWLTSTVWIRFDRDADVIEGLPTFPWANL